MLPYTKTESETGHEYLILHQRDHFDIDKHHGEMDLIMPTHLCLKCGVCLELRDTNSEYKTGFYLNNVSHTEGTGILYELIKAVKYSIDVKTNKIKKRTNDFVEYWLVLVDYISPVPHSGLSSTEMTELRNGIDVPDPWSRIIVISSKNVKWYYDLYLGKS